MEEGPQEMGSPGVNDEQLASNSPAAGNSADDIDPPELSDEPVLELSLGRGNGKALHPYLAGSLNATAKRKSKSNHIATIKSLGMLHDLQEYISSVEALASDHKRELDRVKEEKRDIEKAFFKVDRGEDKFLLDFNHSELADMPPKLRAVFEENRVLKEKLKKYKGQNQECEDELTKRQNKILVLNDSIAMLKLQLNDCSRSPEEVATADELSNALELAHRKIHSLEHAVHVLQHKIVVDAKLAMQAAKASAKERDGLKRDIVQGNVALEEKNTELRAALLEVRKLQRLLAPVRGAPSPLPFLQNLERIASPTQIVQAEQESGSPGQASGVHVMVLVVKDSDGTVSLDNRPSGARAVPQDFPAGDLAMEDAATMLQACFWASLDKHDRRQENSEREEWRRRQQEQLEEMRRRKGLSRNGATSEAPAQDEMALATKARAEAPVAKAGEAVQVDPGAEATAESAPEGEEVEKDEFAGAAPKSVPYSRTAARAEDRKNRTSSGSTASAQDAAAAAAAEAAAAAAFSSLATVEDLGESAPGEPNPEGVEGAEAGTLEGEGSEGAAEQPAADMNTGEEAGAEAGVGDGAGEGDAEALASEGLMEGSSEQVPAEVPGEGADPGAKGVAGDEAAASLAEAEMTGQETAPDATVGGEEGAPAADVADVAPVEGEASITSTEAGGGAPADGGEATTAALDAQEAQEVPAAAAYAGTPEAAAAPPPS